MPLWNRTPWVAVFAIAVERFSIFVAALYQQSKVVAITSTIICLIAVADGRSAPPVTALSSWWRAYSLTVLKSDPSVVQRIGLVICAPTITVIADAIASFTLIATSRAVFYRSASSWALALVVILGGGDVGC